MVPAGRVVYEHPKVVFVPSLRVRVARWIPVVLASIEQAEQSLGFCFWNEWFLSKLGHDFLFFFLFKVVA